MKDDKTILEEAKEKVAKIFIKNGEPLYLKEGFPQKPQPPPERRKDLYNGTEFSDYQEKLFDYEKLLQSSIDKALMFENPPEIKSLIWYSIEKA